MVPFTEMLKTGGGSRGRSDKACKWRCQAERRNVGVISIQRGIECSGGGMGKAGQADGEGTVPQLRLQWRDEEKSFLTVRKCQSAVFSTVSVSH